MKANEALSLRGNTLRIYHYILKTKKPVGIREIQKSLKLSTPSLVQYHLEKLENLGLVKKETGNYVISRVVLENYLKIKSFFIPKFLIFSIFAAFVLIAQLSDFLTNLNFYQYFSIPISLIFLVIFVYETMKVRLKKI